MIFTAPRMVQSARKSLGRLDLRIRSAVESARDKCCVINDLNLGVKPIYLAEEAFRILPDLRASPESRFDSSGL
jgi:hypothetical protein